MLRNANDSGIINSDFTVVGKLFFCSLTTTFNVAGEG